MDLHDQHVYMEKTGQWRFTPPTHVVVALAEAVTQFVEEGGQPARLARYSDNCKTLIDGMQALGLQAVSPARDPGADHRHLPRAGAQGLRVQALLRSGQAARLHPLPGQADADRDLPRRLHRRDRAQRDEPGRGRCGRHAARDGHPQRHSGAVERTEQTIRHGHTKEPPGARRGAQVGHQKVKVACSDIDGILRGKYLHIDKFLGAAEPHPKGGFGFCDVVFGWDSGDQCYDNAQVTGWQHGFPDALARLDLDTARQRAVGQQRAVLPRRIRQRRRHALPGVPAPDFEAGARSAPRSSAST